MTHRFFSSAFSRVRAGFILAIGIFGIAGWYAIQQTQAHSTGITGCTQKSNSDGCYCHCTAAASSTTVTLTSSSGTSPLTTAPNTTYNFTIKVASSSSSEVDGGCDVATYSGNGLTAGSDGLYASSGELTHGSPKSFGGNGYCTWSFTYTSGSSSGWDTIYATGNAVNDDGWDDGNCEDNWNWAPKFIIHNVVPTVRMALSRSSISLGSVRVGHRAADSLRVTSNGQNAITISSSTMKSGASFSSYPTTSNRTINPGSSEIDSAIFTPTSRGSFNDSLIFNTNSDTVPEQRMGAYVSGQGIQAVFSATNGTTLSFGNLHVGRSAQQTFSFSNSGDDTLFLQTPTESGAGFSIVTGPSTLTYPPNGSGSVVMQFAPTAMTSYSGTLNFTASNGVSAPTVSLSGTGTLPEIQIGSTDNLGSTPVGQTLQGSIGFKNIGTDTLHLSNATLVQKSNLFTLGTYNQAVLPGANGSVSVSYTPNAEETDSATLQFKTDDPTDSAVSVLITGAGLLAHMSVSEADDTVSLGQIKINSLATTGIAIRNTGGATLTITSVTGGPPPFSISSSPSSIAANSSASVTVAFLPTDTGRYTGKVVIQGNDTHNPSDTVFVTGSGINSALSINPGSVNFGNVPKLATAYDTVTLSDSGKANVTVYSVQLTPSNSAFAIVGATPTQVVAGGSVQILLSFTPDSAGIYSGSLNITTDDASAPTRTVNLSGEGTSDPFSITPSALSFGQVPVSTIVMDTITMQNTGTSSVTIYAFQLSAASGGFAVVDSSSHSVSAGASATVVVSFDPTSAVDYVGTLTINTNDVSDPVRTIDLSGEGIKGSLTIKPSPIDFGNLLTGHDSSIHAALRNVGSASVTVNSASISGPTASAFNDGSFPTPITIGAGDSTSLEVTFAPAYAVSYTDTLHFELGDGTSIFVPLMGEGENAGVSENQGIASSTISISPNPAGNSMHAHVSLSVASNVTIDLFDVLGHQVSHLSMGLLSAGTHDAILSTNDLLNGTYFVRLTTGDGTATQSRLSVEHP